MLLEREGGGGKIHNSLFSMAVQITINVKKKKAWRSRYYLVMQHKLGPDRNVTDVNHSVMAWHVAAHGG